ncbi:hypothetical protein MAHJHV58_00180 [Mycobacterium avium subsp. hominissuis]|uniref:FtsK/SpoIIIE domain-containing protein n=1 Tax=Mycobacterium avium TaxID=1764 RepID=UPI000A81110E|nr:FtsK/SpoIIIE domain-containing protein [Mycobacterium avium]MCA4736663.1 hypothetical protein [Mycobacterium avium subsp. hominissuis]MCA4741244.1 hypothetical protein [Mycobacterium avium subsp. hominissuis]MCA4745951.1 hypothetical protein [Mycobacterium avium subsp. hominissuis]MCA4766117.1 hypothetical protein [Mycobacterium avium subsp. hominissuis]MDO2386081.1 FtsK/SpoIIIE domain-containing protein [Mycobacterium avium subsp. hominissuis]
MDIVGPGSGATTDDGAAGAEAAEFAALFGVTNLSEWRPWWRGGPTGAGLAAYLARDGSAAPVSVDIMSSALGGDGPHGIILGPPGSGKTQTAALLVLSLCASYSPEALQVLVLPAGGDDAAGGGLQVLSSLPQLRAVSPAPIDNHSGGEAEQARLAASAAAVRRELRTRAQTLRAIHPARRPSQGPHLLVVVDDVDALEKSSYATQWKELLWRVVSQGAALNAHVLVCSATLSPGVRVLLPHMRYRIVMGTHDADASAAVLGGGVSGETPIQPGAALISTDRYPDPRPWTVFDIPVEDGRVRERVIDQIIRAHGG